jgi:hypothetical protein
MCWRAILSSIVHLQSGMNNLRARMHVPAVSPEHDDAGGRRKEARVHHVSEQERIED